MEEISALGNVVKLATYLIPYVVDFTDSRLKTSEWVGPVIVTFLTLHNFNLDDTWPVKRSSVIILGLTLSCS